ncbi:MAG: hypothetical protein ACLUNZ_07215 [Evtepia sp.]
MCGLRILWVFLVVPHWPTLLGISICYPLSWVLTALLLILHTAGRVARESPRRHRASQRRRDPC